MRFIQFATLVGLLAAARPAAAQSCTPPPNPLFEFEVERPVQYTGDSTLTPRPAGERFVKMRSNPEALVVQFVVDTLGQPVERSLQVLQAPSAAAAERVRAVLPRWRFSPAIHRGCKVPQLLQTAVAH